MATVYTDTLINELVDHFTKILTKTNNKITKIASIIADTQIIDADDLETLKTAGEIKTSAERALALLGRVMSVPVDDRFETLIKNLPPELLTSHLQDLIYP